MVIYLSRLLLAGSEFESPVCDFFQMFHSFRLFFLFVDVRDFKYHLFNNHFTEILHIVTFVNISNLKIDIFL